MENLFNRQPPATLKDKLKTVRLIDKDKFTYFCSYIGKKVVFSCTKGNRCRAKINISLEDAEQLVPFEIKETETQNHHQHIKEQVTQSIQLNIGGKRFDELEIREYFKGKSLTDVKKILVSLGMHDRKEVDRIVEYVAKERRNVRNDCKSIFYLKIEITLGLSTYFFAEKEVSIRCEGYLLKRCRF